MQTPPEQDCFEASYSPWRLLVLTLLAAGFVAAGLWMVGAFGTGPGNGRYPTETAYIIGMICILFFGLCGVVSAWKALSGGIAIRVDHRGIHDMRLSNSPIPWDNIVGMGDYAISSNKFLGLTVSDADRLDFTTLARKSAGMNNSLTGFPYAVGTTGTDKSHDELMAAVDRFLPTADL